MHPLVSIVLPVYNGEQFLRQSIDSIIAQTFQDWELLILDDCSTDSSPDIAREYAGSDQRIHYYRNEQNLRLPGNLNKGFSLARGDYLTWTSDDNLYRPTALEKMVRALQEQPSAHLVFASCQTMDELGNPIDYIMVNEHSKKRIVGIDSVGACFLYTRKAYETVGDYDTDYILVEDFDYWQRIFHQFDTVAIEEILYDYRFHSGALTSTMRQEVHGKNLERMLLKNRPGFGRLDLEETYYYYAGLYASRKKQTGTDNPYTRKYKFYSFLHLVCHRVPNKIRRELRRLLKGKTA